MAYSTVSRRERHPLILRHYLAGIQFALGDLDWLTSEQKDAARSPVAKP